MSESARLMELRAGCGEAYRETTCSWQEEERETLLWRQRRTPTWQRLALLGGLSAALATVALVHGLARWPTHTRSRFEEELVVRDTAIDQDYCGPVDQDTEYHTRVSLYWVGNIRSWEECCAECDADPDCGAWTFVAKEKPHGHCYLKRLASGEKPTKIKRSGVVSGSTKKKLAKHGVIAGMLANPLDRKPHFIMANETCPGQVSVEGAGAFHVVSALWTKPNDRGSAVDVPHGWSVEPHLNSRAYLAESCKSGFYNHSSYAALKLLGRTIRYTTDLSRAGCGCNAQLHLAPMRANKEETHCHDYFCSHGRPLCGASCATIGLQDSNKYAWSSQLHTESDPGGANGGYGGGWLGGRRNWDETEYGPGAKCVDTTWPFDVEVSFPVNERGTLEAMEVTLTQEERPCNLRLRIDKYHHDGHNGLEELSNVLQMGVTPAISYWSSPSLGWMDGAGPDGKGPCVKDSPEACPETVRFYNFAVLDRSRPHAVSDESVIETALDTLHEDTEQHAEEERKKMVNALEAIEGEDCMGKCTKAVHISNISFAHTSEEGEDAEGQLHDGGRFVERTEGNEEWEVMAERVHVRKTPDQSSPRLDDRTKGETIFGRLEGEYVHLSDGSGVVSTEGLRHRTVSYEKVVAGNCEDNNMFPINGFRTCAKAAASLGYFGTKIRAFNGHSFKRPEGCYVFKGQIWLATSKAHRGNGADEERLPICSSREYATTTPTTTTTSTTTRTTTTRWPSFFCVEVVRMHGYEFPLVQEQLRRRASIFNCDAFQVFSDGGFVRTVGIGLLGEEVKTMVIPPIVESRGNIAQGATTSSWLNTQTFLQVWDICNKDGRLHEHDWTVKVDPDAVFFPARLRPHLTKHTYKGAKFYVMNCNRWGPALFGSIEVFSKGAMQEYLRGQWTCRKKLNWHGWGEDYFMSHCMDMLKVGRIYDWTLLSDKRCYYHPCSDTSKVAYHDYKDARPNGSWFSCFHTSLMR